MKHKASQEWKRRQIVVDINFHPWVRKRQLLDRCDVVDTWQFDTGLVLGHDLHKHACGFKINSAPST